MGITDSVAALTQKPNQPPVQAPSWIQELINKRAEDPRKKRTPLGFDFQREPFDPSSYYRALNTYKQISQGATAVSQQQANNREEARLQKEFEQNQGAINGALGGVNPKFNYSGKTVNRQYSLRGISKTTSRAADYFGSKYGIKTIGGLGPGSVPGSDHPKGRALDFMINNVSKGKARGDALANDLIRNYKKYNVKYVIWYHYIWQPGRGWHKYNGPSAHTDHVHASFNN